MKPFLSLCGRHPHSILPAALLKKQCLNKVKLFNPTTQILTMNRGCGRFVSQDILGKINFLFQTMTSSSKFKTAESKLYKHISQSILGAVSQRFHAIAMETGAVPIHRAINKSHWVFQPTRNVSAINCSQWWLVETH